MALSDLEASVRRFGDRADADVDAAFNAQHDLARKEQAAVVSITAVANERYRRDEIARVAALAAANGDDGNARFGPLDDDEPEPVPVTNPRRGPSPSPPGHEHDDSYDDSDDDEEGRQTWLR